MRTILLTLMLLLTLTACAGKEDTPIEGANSEVAQTEEVAGETATDEDSEANAALEEEVASVGILKETGPTGPIGSILLKDGTSIEFTEFNKLGRYYLYISGKLNGRSSTVISLTRLRDVQRWKAIQFKDPYNFIITTDADTQLRFIDSRIYIGSKSHDSYSFYIINNRYEKELIDVKKTDIDTIVIN